MWGGCRVPVIDPGGIGIARYPEPLAMIRSRHFYKRGFNGKHAFELSRN